jgi:hypothetical protein
MTYNHVKDLIKLIQDNKELVKSNPKLSDSLYEMLEKARDDYDDWNNRGYDDSNTDDYGDLSTTDDPNRELGDDDGGSSPAQDWLDDNDKERSGGSTVEDMLDNPEDLGDEEEEEEGYTPEPKAKPQPKPEPEAPKEPMDLGDDSDDPDFFAGHDDDDQYSDDNINWDDYLDDDKKEGKDSFVDKMDDNDLEDWQHFAHHWSNVGRQMTNQTADAKVNPLMFAEGHASAAHNKSYKNFREAYQDFKNTDEYKAMDDIEQAEATMQFKKDFREKNPNHRKDALAAHQKASEMRGKALEHYGNKKEAALDHLLSGGGVGSGEDAMSADEARAQFGTVNKDGTTSSNTRSTVESSFASQNPEFLQSIKDKRGLKNVKESDEVLENPEQELYRHPSLSNEHSGKMDQLFSEYSKLIDINIKKGKNKLISKGIPENEIDESDLREQAMFGMVNAVKSFKKDRGTKFNTHATSHIQSLIESGAANKDPIHRGLRSELKSWRNKNIDPSTGKAIPSQDQSEDATEAPSPQPASGATSVEDFKAQGGQVTQAPAQSSEPEPTPEPEAPKEPTSHTLTKDPQILDRIKRVKAAGRKKVPTIKVRDEE